jgi:UDP-glucose 4-epimerase
VNSRRILITGLSSHLGGRLAQALERDPDVDSIVGIDTEDPRHELQRTEFVRVEIEPGLLRRILNAAAIDTVLDTRLLTNPLLESLPEAHAVNVTDTAAILDACDDRGSPVRKIVFKSSAHYYGWGPGGPAFLREDMPRRSPPGAAIERDVVEAETAVSEFAARHPDTTVTITRLADELEGDARASRLSLLSLPVIPSMLGFDPRFQFVHEDDVVGALAFAARHDLPGVYNVAGDGVLVLSEVVSLLGKTMLPVLPPWGASFAVAQLRRLGLRMPVETLRQLRYGRGLDNRRLKAAGYSYRYTSREAVLKLRARQRLQPLLQSGAEGYRYEPEVEEFLRWSPSVQSADTRGAPAAPQGTEHGAYDGLTDTELIDLIASLEPEALARLRRYEAAHQARGSVLAALDRTLARKRPSDDSR